MMREQLSNQPHYNFGLHAVINFLKHLRSIKETSVTLSTIEVIFIKIFKKKKKISHFTKFIVRIPFHLISS